MKVIKELIKQLFCKHEYYEYNTVTTVDERYTEHCLICRKCSHHKWITIWNKRK